MNTYFHSQWVSLHKKTQIYVSGCKENQAAIRHLLRYWKYKLCLYFEKPSSLHHFRSAVIWWLQRKYSMVSHAMNETDKWIQRNYQQSVANSLHEGQCCYENMRHIPLLELKDWFNNPFFVFLFVTADLCNWKRNICFTFIYKKRK